MNKKKITATATAVAVAVTAGAVMVTNSPTTVETPTTQYEQYVEGNEKKVDVSEEEKKETAKPTNATLFDENGELNQSIEDILAPYRTEVIKDGKILYYYKDVPFELQGYVLQQANQGGTMSVGAIDGYALSDVSVMSNYIFVNTGKGLKYLSEISNGKITDEQIENSDFTDYNVFINAFLGDISNFEPFKNFNGFFYGNNFDFSLDGYLFENFGGQIEKITITSSKAVAKNATATEVKDCNFFIEGTSDINGVIEVGNAVKMKNVYVEANLSGEIVGGLIGVASGECDIKNCIVYGSLSASASVGSYIGKLENPIVFKNNLATTTVEAVLGYGGKAVGMVNYDYTDDIDKVNGAYCDTKLTVEGLESQRFIGNIEEPVPTLVEIPIYEHSDVPAETLEKASTSLTTKDGTVLTVYNLSLIPSEIKVLVGTYTEARFDENAPNFNGFYDIKDLVAMNEFATSNDLKKFYEENGRVYFEDENTGDADIYFDNLVYSKGDCVAFIEGDFSGGTLIVASYIENQLFSLTSHVVTGKGTYFTHIDNSDETTEVKAFLWSGLDTLTPMCEAKNVNTAYGMYGLE